jgi:dihydrofolate reductase
MILSTIVAVSDNHAIGINNQLPWHLPNDLKFFKKTTLGKPVMMGRKTFESLGRPLPGRLNIVISHQKELNLPEGVLLFHSISEGISRIEKENAEEGFIIGGGKIFEETLSLVDRLYLTKVQTNIENADAFFPEIDHTHWRLVWEEKNAVDEKHLFPYTFQQLERINL